MLESILANCPIVPNIAQMCGDRLQDVVETHPGLAFLQGAPEFHTRYVSTVIARLFYEANVSWSGRLTIAELRHSNFLQVLSHHLSSFEASPINCGK